MTTINPGPDLTPGRRRLILAICCMSLLLVSIDVTIVNVALPSIQHDLHASVSGLQWIIDAYTLVLASLLLLSGSTADRFGRRRTFQVGLALFTLGSLLCSVAPSLGWLVAFRAVQAVGGSMLNPVAMSIITNVFTEPGERARAIGVWGAVVGVSLGLGPVLGGVLVDSIGWRSIFWVNIPVGVAALVLTALFVPESRAGAVAPPRPGRSAAGDRGPRRPVVRDHRRAATGLDLAGDRVPARRCGRGAHRPGALRGAARRAAGRRAVLPQCAVLRRRSDGRVRLRRVRRVPLPQHALPAGRPPLLRRPGRALHPADGRHGLPARALVRAHHRSPGPAHPVGRRRRRHDRRAADAHPADCRPPRWRGCW